MPRGPRDTNLASDTEFENLAKGKTLEHRFWFSANDAATEKPSTKRSLETDSESEVSEMELQWIYRLWKVSCSPKHDEFKWDIPENLAKYTNDHFNKFIPEKDLQESILVNLHPPRKMDEFERSDIWKKSWQPRGSSRLKFSQAAATITRFYGTIVEKTSNSCFEQLEVSLPEILTNLDQTVMLLGQAFNKITGDPRKTR